MSELAAQKEIESAEKIGIEKGKNKKAIEIAKSLKDSKVDIDIISKTTGLTKDQIGKL